MSSLPDCSIKSILSSSYDDTVRFGASVQKCNGRAGRDCRFERKLEGDREKPQTKHILMLNLLSGALNMPNEPESSCPSPAKGRQGVSVADPMTRIVAGSPLKDVLPLGFQLELDVEITSI